MLYIKKKAVKQRVRQLGYRVSPTFFHMLDLTVETILMQVVNWTRPAKTFRGDTLAEYLHWHRIKKRQGGK